jgi:hypothetical protein
MRLFLRTTLAASLLAACQTAPPAHAPSPAAQPPMSVSAAATSTAAPLLAPRFAQAEAPRLTGTRASAAVTTERANTRGLLIVAAIAVVAVAAIVLFGTSTDPVY